MRNKPGGAAETLYSPGSMLNMAAVQLGQEDIGTMAGVKQRSLPFGTEDGESSESC